MTEILITILAIVIIGVLTWLLYRLLEKHTAEQNKLINALIAKNPEQMRDLTLADKVKPIEPSPNLTTPDLIPEQNLDEDAFDKMIQDQLANE